MQILVLQYDSTPENPRTWDNLGTMVCWHRRYNLGDSHDFKTPDDFLTWAKKQDMALLLPLYLLDHGGLRLSLQPFNDPWDSGQVGWVYLTKERLRKEYGVTRITQETLGKASAVLTAEVTEYDYYLSGQVYGFQLWAYDESGVNLLDSCYGFYGPNSKESGLSDAVPDVFRPHLAEVDLNYEVLVEENGQVAVLKKRELQRRLKRQSPAAWLRFHELENALAV
ncbi:MAG: hypothetical protein QXI12_10655 [Candidatus Methanomethyliaceae archaeon]